MATVYVDDKPYQMNPDQNLLHGCLSQGLKLPYFCWHPALGSVGACRQCAVKQFKDEHDEHGKIVMSCMTAGGGRHAHLHRRSRSGAFPRRHYRRTDAESSARLPGVR